METSVPQVSSLKDIYDDDDLGNQSPRWATLQASFQRSYARAPSFIARSPGRVNIIGEHIDYNMYDVLPMAIMGDILIATSSFPTTNAEFTINIANTASIYNGDSLTFKHDSSIVFDSNIHLWTNYFKAGLAGALEVLRKDPDFKPASMNVLVDGNVPAAAGLSSSGAFVVSSALAVLFANGRRNINKNELTEMAVASERAIGMNGGGMDQTASIFARRGAALHVSFLPVLQARPIIFPATEFDFCFMIAQTYVEAVKHKTAPIHYNLRVVECSLSAAVLHVLANLPSPLFGAVKPQTIPLRDFQTKYFESQSPSVLSVEEQLDEMISVTQKKLTQEHGYTRQEIATLLSITEKELELRFMTAYPVRAERFKLRQRSLHVFSEAKRVQHAISILGKGAHSNIAEHLGKLMNESQESCRLHYDCSASEIDSLCRIARAEGAYGSRLTGAGWGGCTVHLVPTARVDSIKTAWKERFYDGLKLSKQEKDDAIIVSKPGSGTVVFLCTGDTAVA